MSLPKTPEGWAIKITKILNHLDDYNYLPLKQNSLISIAYDFSKQMFPDDPITMVKAASIKGFEGMLKPSPDRSEWCIIYNEDYPEGRVNFTLAHELGHYFAHRHNNPEGIECQSKDMLKWDSEEYRIEAEANSFAAYLLMPMNDFRKQLEQFEISHDFFLELKNRYAVSLVSVLLQWLKETKDNIMVVVSRDDHIDWARSSNKLFKNGIYYKARQQVIELPKESLAHSHCNTNAYSSKSHKRGVWTGDEEVKELYFPSSTGDYNISLLFYPKNTSYVCHSDGEEIQDTYSKFMS